jgi:hypothetical protein
MPRLHDHEYQIIQDGPNAGASVTVLPLTASQYRHMENWANERFIRKLPARPPLETICDALDRVSLEACAGGPFYPGMEAPRIMRNPRIYAGPFRLDVSHLDPGIITAGLAIPWQADFQACQMDGDNAWWPVTRPDKVLLRLPQTPDDPLHKQDLAQEVDMVRWDEGISGASDMVDNWDKLGIVRNIQVKKPASVNSAPPPPFFIETQRVLDRPTGS